MMANKKTLLASSALEERQRCAATIALALFLVATSTALSTHSVTFASFAVVDRVEGLLSTRFLLLLEQRHLKNRASQLALGTTATLLFQPRQAADPDRQPAPTRH